MDLQSAARNNKDQRIRFARATPVDVLDVRSFSGISIPVALVNLGQPGKIPATVLAAEATKAIPVAHYAMIEDASHFSMFAACKPGASAIAESETIGDPICMDGGGWPRNAIHAQLIDMGGAAFGRALKAE